MSDTYGLVYVQGATNLKINKIDSGGMDRSAYLGSLESIVIDYSDLGPIDYQILSRQDMGSYYAYTTAPRQHATESVDFDLPKQFITLVNNTTWTIPAFQTGIVGPVGFWDIGPTNSDGWIVSRGNSSMLPGGDGSGGVRFFQTPNVNMLLGITSSFASVGTGDIFYRFGQHDDDLGTFFPGSWQYSQSVNGTPGDKKTTVFNIQMSQSVVEQTYYLAIRNATPSSLTLDKLTLEFSGSQYPASGSYDIVVFSPDGSNWDVSDYNISLGNAFEPELSTKYMDIDYILSSYTPVNFELLVSGTADRAAVQDSNYYSSTWSNIRYKGSRVSAYQFNQPFTTRYR
jgi:hypothetical protein